MPYDLHERAVKAAMDAKKLYEKSDNDYMKVVEKLKTTPTSSGSEIPQMVELAKRALASLKASKEAIQIAIQEANKALEVKEFQTIESPMESVFMPDLLNKLSQVNSDMADTYKFIRAKVEYYNKINPSTPLEMPEDIGGGKRRRRRHTKKTRRVKKLNGRK
jgi:hypothetical protein